MRRSLLMLLALTALAATAASAATVSKSFPQTAKVRLNVTPSGCENNPGPYIRIDGGLTLSGVGAKILLSNNVKFTHSASTEVLTDFPLLPGGDEILIAKQPSRGGVGGNPWIYLQYLDGSGSPIGAPIKLGRCVQGLANVNGVFPIPTDATVNILSGGGCSNNPGPFVTLDGEIRLGGLGGRIILTNNAKFTHMASTDIAVDFVLIEDGDSRTFPKQPSRGGVTGNPIIWLQFTDGSGNAIGSPYRLGRCNQL